MRVISCAPVEPPCVPPCCCSTPTACTEGALWPGIAANSTVTIKIAPTTIAAWVMNRTTDFRADMNSFLRLGNGRPFWTFPGQAFLETLPRIAYAYDTNG